MKYTIKISRPLDESSEALMLIPLSEGQDPEKVIDEQLPGILEQISADAAGMDDLITQFVGRPPDDLGAGLGNRDLMWYDLDWETVSAASQELLGIPGNQCMVSIMSMDSVQKEDSNGLENNDSVPGRD